MKLLLLVLFLSPSLFAAVPNSSLDENIILALRQPHEVAVHAIKRTGAKGLTKLKQMAFSDKWPMKTRWKSFMAMTEIQGKKSIPEIKRALMSRTWFMRSAGLTALKKIDSLAAKKWAYQKLNQDPALLVRMKALEILKDEKSEKIKELFWKKVYSQDSLHRKKSLWIRGDIARILLKEPRKRDLQRWVKMLHQSDKELQIIASKALSKLNSGAVAPEKVSYWQTKYPQSKKM